MLIIAVLLLFVIFLLALLFIQNEGPKKDTVYTFLNPESYSETCNNILDERLREKPLTKNKDGTYTWEGKRFENHSDLMKDDAYYYWTVFGIDYNKNE